MRKYRQLTSGERYALSALRKQGHTQAEIARALGRHRSTISREVRRNSKDRTGRVYRPALADDYARWRRSRSRRNQRLTPEDWATVVKHLRLEWSPEQIAGRYRKAGGLRISHETIYRYVWQDKRRGGTHYEHLRQSGKKRRKRYGAYDSRGRLAGKRPISQRPAAVENRSEPGHWEIDTVLGKGRPCIATLVERSAGYVMIGKLKARTVAEPHPLRPPARPHDHGRQRHRVPRLQGARGRDRRSLLLRHAPPLLGTRHESPAPEAHASCPGRQRRRSFRPTTEMTLTSSPWWW
jgi:IS30 family transposase